MDVFISYQHDSKEIADKVVAYLEKKRLKCWYAPRDVAGSYAGSIMDAIENCKLFVLILSQKSSESVQVLNEVENAYERVAKREIEIVPFKVDDGAYSKDMLYYVKRLHWVDGTNLNDGLPALYQIIAKLLNLTEKNEPNDAKRIKPSATNTASDNALDKGFASDAASHYQIGYKYKTGNGLPKDAKSAVHWWTKAAELGLAIAQNALGNCYFNGDGVERDLNKAAYWWAKAAEQGFANAQFNLGSCYVQGNGVQKDVEKAVYWWTKAAEQGFANAQNNLGTCYVQGNGVQKDAVKAFYWWTKAAEQGFANAQCNVGSCYAQGNGVQKDVGKAVYWWTKAAEQGLAEAQCNLGGCYYVGNGVIKNIDKAKELWQKAAAQGLKPAKENLKKLFGI